MTDIEPRVLRCFQNVFPGVGSARLSQATLETLPEWDSVAHVTLLSALAEEFQIELDEEWFESLTSYQTVLELVRTHTGQGS